MSHDDLDASDDHGGSRTLDRTALPTRPAPVSRLSAPNERFRHLDRQFGVGGRYGAARVRAPVGSTAFKRLGPAIPSGGFDPFHLRQSVTSRTRRGERQQPPTRARLPREFEALVDDVSSARKVAAARSRCAAAATKLAPNCLPHSGARQRGGECDEEKQFRRATPFEQPRSAALTSARYQDREHDPDAERKPLIPPAAQRERSATADT